MKKLLTAVILMGLSSGSLTAQMQIKKLDGTLINNGDVYTYSTVDTEDSILHFTVANTSATQPIKVKVLCESITNSDGQSFEFCYGGNCMPFVLQNQNYPPDGYEIAPNSNSGDGDHFWNRGAVSTTGQYPLSYTFKFSQVDAFGNELGNPVRLTYKYSGPLAVKETSLQKSGLEIKNTLVTDNLNLNATNGGKINIIDMAGNVVLSKNILKGENKINLQNLLKGNYVISFYNESGVTGSSKIVKK